MMLAVTLVLGVGGMLLAAAETAAPDAKAAPAAKAAANLHVTLVKVDGKSLVVKVKGAKGQPDKEMTIATDDKTKFLLDYEDAKLADLKPDMTLTVKPATGTATWVSAHVKGLTGVVVKVDGQNLVLTVKTKEVTIATDAKTKIVIDGKAGGKLADLKAGTQVKVIPETGTATKIAVVPPTKAAGKAAAGKADTGKAASTK